MATNSTFATMIVENGDDVYKHLSMKEQANLREVSGYFNETMMRKKKEQFQFAEYLGKNPTKRLFKEYEKISKHVKETFNIDFLNTEATPAQNFASLKKFMESFLVPLLASVPLPKNPPRYNPFGHEPYSDPIRYGRGWVYGKCKEYMEQCVWTGFLELSETWQDHGKAYFKGLTDLLNLRKEDVAKLLWFAGSFFEHAGDTTIISLLEEDYYTIAEEHVTIADGLLGFN
ncbi:hypothetical protein M427DRAFT_50229 [Gonapodya prolifera JEL478]|uniref:Uncharacterized protein n=1 Tax=Gonapodya prolifera (strain JEL478) TaxID=1344416 RepID=A0A138ZWP1_GONPJ|nr:hypothetical protein M427DRAFT_50229 [Gonapodya prolifera JEL478]|eukprot:KXS08891.1 hypothetical protein M427DRAFT_50229 [Gonapodya prolifera JEL478]